MNAGKRLIYYKTTGDPRMTTRQIKAINVLRMGISVETPILGEPEIEFDSRPTLGYSCEVWQEYLGPNLSDMFIFEFTLFGSLPLMFFPWRVTK